MITKLKFDNNFYEEEVRCDYKITSVNKKNWAVQLDLLNELLEVCKKHDIKVIVFAGTILGAVRHCGYIPWDDDIDVALDRENYEKLLKVAPSEFKDPYFLQTGINDRRFFLNYARLRNSSTTCIISWNKSEEYNNGMYIDVFVLDGYPENEKDYNHFIKKKERMEWWLKFYGQIEEQTGVRKCIKSVVRFFYKMITNYNASFDKYNDFLQKYSKSSRKIGLMTHGDYFRKRYWLYREELENIVYLNFETLKVPVPANYDAILKRTYGNYMEFPPVEKRGAWHEGYYTMDPDTPYKEYFKKINGNEKNRK